MWRDFIAYQVVAGLPPCQVNTRILLSFMEYLHQNSISSNHIANYISALRAFHVVYSLDTSPFKDEKISLFLKSVKIQASFSPSTRSYIDLSILQDILIQCEKFPHPDIFRPLYLLCFFSFLRLSNILPHTVNSFDSTRQLQRGDFIVAGQGAVLLIKWTKTMQDRNHTVTIPLPNLGNSSFCPIRAIQNMLLAYPASDQAPLFIIPRTSNLVPLTDSVARKHLKNISVNLAISPPLTFHAFRRAGAMWSFQQGVPLEHIMKHGTWKSDAVWAYLSSLPSATSQVSLAFQHSLAL